MVLLRISRSKRLYCGAIWPQHLVAKVRPTGFCDSNKSHSFFININILGEIGLSGEPLVMLHNQRSKAAQQKRAPQGAL
jgi:hypothetical protein